MEPDDDSRVFFGQLRGCLEKRNQLALLVIRDSQGLFSSTDKRLATEFAIVKSRAAEGEADLSWIGSPYQIGACLSKYTSRKSVEVLQQVVNQAPWSITTGKSSSTRTQDITQEDSWKHLFFLELMQQILEDGLVTDSGSERDHCTPSLFSYAVSSSVILSGTFWK